MGASTGVTVIGDYATPGTDPLKVQALIDMLPDPDTTSTSGAVAGSLRSPIGAGLLDEISVGALVQLRVELVALKAAVS